MKKLTVVVKPFKTDAVVRALVAVGAQAVTLTEARGYGRQKGHLDLYRDEAGPITFLPKFYRFARKGRDLYSTEKQWPASSFWSLRRSWPDLQPVHQEFDPASVHVAMRPVVSNGLIVEEEVVITNDEPLGIST